MRGAPAADEVNVETLRLVYADLIRRRDFLQDTLRTTVLQLGPLPASAAVVIGLLAALEPARRVSFPVLLVGLASFLAVVGFSAWLATVGLRRWRIGRGHEGAFEVPVQLEFVIEGDEVEQQVRGPGDPGYETRQADPTDAAFGRIALGEAASALVPADDAPVALWLRKSIALLRHQIAGLEHSLERSERLLTTVQVLLAAEVSYLVLVAAFVDR